MKKLYSAPVVDLQEYDNYEVVMASYEYFDPDWAKSFSD